MQAHRQHRRLLDVGALRVGVGERRRAGRPDHRRRRPTAVVEGGTRPTLGVGPPVDPLDEVAAVAVALGGREPLGRVFPPRAVGPVEDVSPIVVPERHLEEETGRRGRAPLARSVPTVQDAEGVGAARADGAGEVDGPDVLLVGIGEAGPGVDGDPVDKEAVGVGGGDVGGGPPDRAATGWGDLLAQVRDPVRLGGGACRSEPRCRRPVGVTQTGDERGGTRRRAPLPGGRLGPHGPAVGGVGGQGRTVVGDECLLGGLDGAAAPDGALVARVGAADLDPVGGSG